MHVISRKRLKKAAAKHPELGGPLDAWYRIAKAASWESLEDVRKTWPSADAVGDYTVFNIKGTSYRLITTIRYRWQRIFIRNVLTHAEYNKERWK